MTCDSIPRTDQAHAGPRSRPAGTYVQIARFLAVGSASVAVDLAVYWLLTAWTPLGWWLSKGISYAAGVVIGYFGNKLWTFELREQRGSEPLLYALLYSTTLLLNIGCNQLSLQLLGSQFSLCAFLLATAVTTVTNFLGMKYVAFRRGIEAQRARLIPDL